MRSPSSWAVAIRTPEGEITEVVQDISSPMQRRKLWRLPVIRGVVALGESLAIGFRALAISANVASQERDENGEIQTQIGRGQIIFSFAIAIGFALLLFKIGPALLTSWLPVESTELFVIVEGADPGRCLHRLHPLDLAAPRPAPRLPVPRRRAQGDQRAGGRRRAHPRNVQKFSLIHPRCGTAFLLWVMVIAIFVFAFVGRPVWYWLIASRILLLPVIAGLAYELIRYAGKHQDNRVLMTLLAPGLWLQRLTTREPSDDQVEVSIQALQRVHGEGGGRDARPAQARVARGSHGLDAPHRPRGGDRLGRNDGAGIRRREGTEHRVVRALVDHRVARRHRRREDEPRRASRGGARDVLRHVAGERARAPGSSTRADARPLHDHDGRGRRLRASDRRLAHLRLGSRTRQRTPRRSPLPRRLPTRAARSRR